MKADIPKEWQNLVWMGKDNYMRMDYAKTNVILWGCVQSLISEITHLKGEVTRLKGKGKGKKHSSSGSEKSKKSTKK